MTGGESFVTLKPAATTGGAMAKERMIESLGERQLLLPGLVAAALAANDRVKYRLTVLQTARAAADGAEPATSLQNERVTAGIEDPQLDRVVGQSAREGDGWYRIPGAEQLSEGAIDDVRVMLVPLEATSSPAASDLAARVEAVAAALKVRDDRISAEDVTRLTSGGGEGEDSLHLVVMEAHRELNALEARMATQTIDGARVHDIDPGDRTLVRAFMRGVNATERLRLDHPGLGTIATRAGSSLVIQNDLGETDAHVVVIRVAGRVVTITYTDVHLARLVFFQDLLGAWPVVWGDTRSRTDASVADGLYHLASGRIEADDDPQLEEFLEYLGSRLVFMIDWNRARKRLRRLVSRRVAIELLRWASEKGYGHMAFLRAGADGLVYDALEFAGGRVARPGESLEDVLGAGAAEAYLRAVIRICSEGLLSGKPESLIQDEVRAELTGYLRSARQEILTLALHHAELSVEIAEAARDALEYAITGAEDRCRRVAARARVTEHEADEIVREARIAVTRAPDLTRFLALVEAADDIADCAEEAAFYATLLPVKHPAGTVRAQVRRIARLVLAAAREYVRAVQLSVELRRGSPRGDMDAFLEAVHQVVTLEHETDDAQRAVHQALVAEDGEPGPGMFVIVELSRAFEESADALMHSAHLIREQTLTRVVGSEPLAGPATGASPPSALRVARDTVGEDLYVVGDPSVPIPDPDLIGGKAYGLARIARAGLPVPESVALTTRYWRSRGGAARGDPTLRETLRGAVDALERRTGLRLGSSRRPLLLSVRSGAPVSMPGMLETILDVGLGDVTARGLIALTGNPRLAWDSYRRLIESYAAVVDGCSREPFEQAVREALEGAEASGVRELPASVLERLVRDHLERYRELTGRRFPQDPMDQLLDAAGAVLHSWSAPKAREYRHLHDIDDGLGTAVLLQRMVFGNAGGISGAGVGFTRDPALGGRRPYLDFLLDAQGEDIVAGRHTAEGTSELAIVAPDLLAEIEAVAPRLESEFGDAEEFEFTVEEGQLFLLQARTAKRTPWAALQIATDQVHEGLISRETALERLERVDLDAIRRVRVQAANGSEPLCHAIPASLGVAAGPLALDLVATERLGRAGHPAVLVRPDTATEDVAAVALAAGVLTAAGSRTSHAAVVARELGKPCLVGCADIAIDLDTRTARIAGRPIAEGETICIDAETGAVYAGSPKLVEERPVKALQEVAAWRAAGPAGNGQAGSIERGSS
jgi:pyruvate, orthophosphate dikinase